MADNLQDLEFPLSQQNGIAYFEVNFIMPAAWINLLSQPAKTDAQVKRRIDKLFKSAPSFESQIQILLQRGDAESREFALYVCTHHPIPLLHEFATGTKGTDVHRLTALRILIEHDKVSIDDLPEIMMNGEFQIPELFKYKISYEPTLDDDIPKHVQRMIEECHELVSERNWYDAIDLIDKTRELLPDNRALMNFEMVTLQGMAEYEEADDVLAEMLEKHSDYHFTRIEKARRLIQQKHYDEVQQWIEPIESQTEFHFSELRGYGITKVEFFIARKEMDRAHNWLHQLEALFPEHSDGFDIYHRQLSVNHILSAVPLFNRFLNK